LILAVAAALFATAAAAEDGHDLWLRYRPVEQPLRDGYAAHATAVVVEHSTPTLNAASSELQRGVWGMLGKRIGLSNVQDGAIVLATDRHLRRIGPEGFAIRSTRMRGHPVTLIAGNREIGVLYGAFAFLRLMQTR